MPENFGWSPDEVDPSVPSAARVYASLAGVGVR